MPMSQDKRNAMRVVRIKRMRDASQYVSVVLPQLIKALEDNDRIHRVTYSHARGTVAFRMFGYAVQYYAKSLTLIAQNVFGVIVLNPILYYDVINALKDSQNFSTFRSMLEKAEQDNTRSSKDG